MGQEWGRRRSDNQPYPKARGKDALQKTMFGPAKHKYLSEIVKLDTPTNARKSSAELRRHFRGAKTHAKKIRIRRATILAQNRATVMSKNKRLSAKERREAREIAGIYGEAYQGMVMRMT